MGCYGPNTVGEADAPEGTFSAVGASDWVTCALDNFGKIQCWGQNTYGQTAPRSEVFSSISVGGADVCGVEAETGRLVRWGRSSFVAGRVASGVVQAACNGHYACVLRDDGSIASWGQGCGLVHLTFPAEPFRSCGVTGTSTPDRLRRRHGQDGLDSWRHT